MQAVEARQHEEGRTVDAGRELQSEIVVGVRVLPHLHAEEDEAEREGGGEEEVEDPAVAFLQRVVGDGEGHARQQQDGGVDRRQAEGRDGLEAAVVAGAEFHRSVGRPAGAVVLPEQQAVEDLHAFAAGPGDGQLPRVEQRAEERGEEHHLGEDEPQHPHAERAVDLHVVHALLVLVDDDREPADEEADQHQRADREDPRPVPLVEPAAEADHEHEQRRRAVDRPRALVGHVVLVGGMVGSVGVCHGVSPSARRPASSCRRTHRKG